MQLLTLPWKSHVHLFRNKNFLNRLSRSKNHRFTSRGDAIDWQFLKSFVFVFLFAETCSPYNHPDTNYNIELNGLTGRLSSRWFPSEYRINMKCRWIITVPTGNRIKLSFQIFDLGATATGQENCDKVDHVEIRDSFNDADPGYGTFCGDVAPAPIYSVGPKMVVTFVSDQETIFQGFEARFDAITGGKLYFFHYIKI